MLRKVRHKSLNMDYMELCVDFIDVTIAFRKVCSSAVILLGKRREISVIITFGL